LSISIRPSSRCDFPRTSCACARWKIVFASDGPAAHRLYEGLPHMDLSRDVLQRASRFLSVVRVPPCGWSDLGTPERLRQYLGRAPHDAARARAPVGAAVA
jgi:hypothetical protein